MDTQYYMVNVAIIIIIMIIVITVFFATLKTLSNTKKIVAMLEAREKRQIIKGGQNYE